MVLPNQEHSEQVQPSRLKASRAHADAAEPDRRIRAAIVGAGYVSNHHLRALRDLPFIKIVHPCQTNGVFVSLPPALMEGLRAQGWQFHDTPDSCRLMCSWDTTEEDVDALAKDVKTLVKNMSNI